MSEQTGNALDQLKAGIRRFQTEVYPQHSAEYEYAATHPQKPHTLIITCADSRIDIETITNSHPGEVFVARNVGNMVPAYGEVIGGVSAVIEYAVSALHVKHAVVCGHMDCGAMKALKSNDSSLDALPTVKSWLNNAHAARSVAASMNDGTPDLKTLTEQNVLLQMAHLETHPSVRGAMARGELSISGWIYDIASGDVLIYNPDTKKFEPTLQSKATTQGHAQGAATA